MSVVLFQTDDSMHENTGEQTFNEMCFVFLGGYSDNGSRILPLSPISLGAPKAKDK